MYRTGPFLVDGFRFEVRSGDRVVSLEPQVMRVLIYFLERPGEVISKRTLLDEVWDGKYVSDDVVAAAVYQIRKAFADKASAPRFLETVRGRGYRWIAPAERQLDEPSRPRHPLQQHGGRAIVAAAALASVVVGVFHWTATPAAPAPEAAVAYEKGRFFLDRRSPESLRLATIAFEEAVRLQPDWSAGHAGLADAWTLRADLGIAPPAEVEEEAKRASERALRLNESSADAWTSVGLTRLLFDFDFPSAEAAFRQAITLDDASPFAHQAYAWLLSSRRRFDEALFHARRASELAPTWASPHLDVAFISSLAGRHDDAVAEIELALQLDPGRVAAHAALGWTHALAGRDAEGLEAFRRFAELSSATEAAPAGDIEDYFRRALTANGEAMGWTAKARLHAVLGEADDAIECLENAYRRRDSAILWVATDPAFASLSGDARFEALLKDIL